MLALWLDMLQPTGLVVGRNTLRELGLIPERQTQVQSAAADAHIEPDTDKPALKDPWGFVAAAGHVSGSPVGPPLPENLLVRLPEHDTTLAPTWAVKELGKGDQPWQFLVRIEIGIDPDKRGALAGWEASAHQRFERLLRETAVFAGLIITDKGATPRLCTARGDFRLAELPHPGARYRRRPPHARRA
jgi:hypothetical protein